MKPAVSDDDLVLFHYGDGLSMSRLHEIEAALAGDASLRARLDALRRLLQAVDDGTVPAADPGYEERLWQQLQPRLLASVPAGAGRERHVQQRYLAARRLRHRLGGATAVVATIAALALAIGLLPKAPPNPERSLVANSPPLPTLRAVTPPVARDRILRDSTASHLRRTEAMLLGVLNSDGTTFIAGSGGQAEMLLDDNRLFAATAARRGDRALAAFLGSLEPVLLELANQTRDAGIQLDQEGMRDVVRDADLLFQVRAVEAGLRAAERQRV